MLINPLSAARTYVARGYAVVPVRSREKAPSLKQWTQLRLCDADLESNFPEGANIGLILGQPSGGLVDIDCDVAEAALIAQKLLPPTLMVHGREGNPRSHHFYLVGTAATPTKFTDDRQRTLLELRGDGQQTIVPPSVHPSGQIIAWYEFGQPACFELGLLKTAVARVAAATILARAWTKGQRHDTANDLAGMLVHAGWGQESIEEFLGAVVAAANDEEGGRRILNVSSAVARFKQGKAVTGAPSLARHVGHSVVLLVRNWLNLDSEAPIRYSAPLTENTEPISAATWPDPLPSTAFHGVAGEIVHAIEPHTEADSAALLLQFLAAVGNVVGRNAYFSVEGDKHYCNLYVLIVGATSKARKGTSWSRIREVLSAVDSPWIDHRIHSGLSSGEGLIWSVRDEVMGTNKKGEVELLDEGVGDKRLLIVESEFASVLRIIERDGNTLSPIIRDAWDRGTLSTLTKNSTNRATNAHISIIGHITKEELLRTLDATERANGFANRFIFVAARRSKLLPEGGAFDLTVISDPLRQLSRVLEFARFATRIERTPSAKERWAEIYTELSKESVGLHGAITSRSEAQVLRLSLVYAVLDCSSLVQVHHLEAALAVWKYAQASVRQIFGEMLGDPIADQILRGLRSDAKGLTRSEISDLLKRHKSEAEIERALALLASLGLAKSFSETTGGRPATRWFATATVK